jgi:uroporphyrinogen decarboxylase
MTSKQRVITALNNKVPDKVPTFEWIINPGIIEKMTGQRSETEFIKQYDIDAIAVSTNMKHEIVNDEHYIDEWGIKRVSYGEYPTPVGSTINNKNDMKKLRIPDPNADFRFDKIKDVMNEIGDEKAIIIRLRDVFSQPRDLMGFEGFLMSFYSQPEFLHALMELSLEYNAQLAENAKKIGGEIIVVGDDIAATTGLLISPAMYREHVLPYFKKLIQKFRNLGFYVIKHTDGNIMDVIEDLIDTGIDCIDPIDPLSGMDIEYIKKKYGECVCIKGNVDCVSTLVDKNPEDVIKETKECILKASVGGGHIISSSNSIHQGINPENYKVFLDTVKEYGTYPLDIESLKQ